MIKTIFKTAWDIFILNLGNYVITTLLMFISYIVLLKISLIGGEFLRPFFLYGMFYIIMKKNEKRELNDFFIAFSNKETAFLLLKYAFLKTVFLSIGFALLVIPGIYFQIATIFTIPILIQNKNIGVINAFKQSIKIFNNNFFTLILVIFILIILNCATAFPYGLFSIFTVPFSICAIGACYKILTERDINA